MDTNGEELKLLTKKIRMVKDSGKVTKIRLIRQSAKIPASKKINVLRWFLANIRRWKSEEEENMHNRVEDVIDVEPDAPEEPETSGVESITDCGDNHDILMEGAHNEHKVGSANTTVKK